jgi:hypothetical protein
VFARAENALGRPSDGRLGLISILASLRGVAQQKTPELLVVHGLEDVMVRWMQGMGRHLQKFAKVRSRLTRVPLEEDGKSAGILHKLQQAMRRHSGTAIWLQC